MRGRIVAALIWAAVAATPAVAQNVNWDSGKTHFDKKEYRQAIVDFQEVVAANPNFANTYFYLGMSHFMLKEYPKAVNDLLRYISLTEKSGKKPEVKARAALGRAYYSMKPEPDYRSAATQLAIVTQTTTDDPINFYFLAAAYQQLDQSDKALEALNAGLKYFPKNVDMLDLSARLLLKRALQSKATADYQAAIARGEQLRLARDNDESAILLASAYLASGDFAKASVHYARVVAARPTDGANWFNYGLSLSRSKQLAKAEPALVKAAELLPDNAGVWAELGYVQESLKNYAKALEAYEKANQLRPDPSLQEAAERVRPFAK